MSESVEARCLLFTGCPICFIITPSRRHERRQVLYFLNAIGLIYTIQKLDIHQYNSNDASRSTLYILSLLVELCRHGLGSSKPVARCIDKNFQLKVKMSPIGLIAAVIRHVNSGTNVFQCCRERQSTLYIDCYCPTRRY